MKHTITEIKEKCLEILKDFKGAIEIKDFKKFLLLNFATHSSGPMGMMSMLGLGQPSSLLLSYDPLRNLYFHKILGGNQEQSQVYLYIKRDPIMDDFITKEPINTLKRYLSSKEMELLGIGTKRKKMIHVTASDFQLLESMKNGNGKKMELGVDLVFKDLKSFVAGYDSRSRIFLMEGDDGDLLFDINFSPLTKKEATNLITFDAYLDETKEIATHSYIIMDKDSQITYSDEIKDTKVQNKLYSLIVPVASLDIP